MTQSIDTTPRCRLSAKLGAGLAIAAMLALGSFATPASADWDGNNRGFYRHNWNGGYYQAPPLVYGSTYDNGYYGTPYYAPPMVYGPGVGISLPGVNIGIR